MPLPRVVSKVTFRKTWLREGRSSRSRAEHTAKALEPRRINVERTMLHQTGDHLLADLISFERKDIEGENCITCH